MKLQQRTVPIKTEGPAVRPPDPLLAWMRGCALAALALAVLVYPLMVRALNGAPPPVPGTLSALLRPYFSFELSPLILKECLAAMALLVSLALAGAWLLVGRRTEPATQAPAGARLWLAFLGWALLSLAWSPSTLLDVECLTSGVLLTVWSLATLALLRLPRPASFDRKLEWTLVGLGLVLMTVSVAQATPLVAPWLAQYMNNWAGPFGRNLYGSFVGHNTGVAVACLGPFFLLTGRLTTARQPWARAALAAALLLAAYFFFVTKTKFVWVSLPWLVPLYLFGLRKVTGWRPAGRHLAAAGGIVLLALAGLALQLWISATTTRGEKAQSTATRAKAEIADYLARLRALSPSNLRQEGTRPRIVACSMSLVASRPLVGHGLASFAPLYPPAQADFFASHRNTRLQPVDAVTVVAHNEYLQTVVETGFAGLALAGGALALFLRAGWRRLRSAADPEDRLRRYSALFGIVSVFLSSLMDFPFHIVPIATVFAFACVLFWGPADTVAGASPAPPTRLPRPVRYVALTAMCVLACGLIVFFARRLESDRHGKAASNLLAQADWAGVRDSPKEQARVMLAAVREYDLSLGIFGPQFDALLGKGQAECQLGRLYASAYAGAVDLGNTEAAKDARANAEKLLSDARRDLLAASRTARERRVAPDAKQPPQNVGPRVNHVLYYYLAETLAALLSMQPNDAAMYHDLVALRALTLRYNPGSEHFATTLLAVLSPTQPEQAELRRFSLDCMMRFHSETFPDKQLARATDLEDSGSLEEARVLLEDLRAVQGTPDRFPEISNRYARWFAKFGSPDDFDAAVAEIKRLRPTGAASVGYLEVCGLLRRGHYAEAIALLDSLPPKSGHEADYWRLARALAVGQMGDVAAADAAERELLRNSPDPSVTLTMRAMARLEHLADAKGAAADYDLALHYLPHPYNLRLTLLLIRAQGAARDYAGLDETKALLYADGTPPLLVRQCLREQYKGRE